MKTSDNIQLNDNSSPLRTLFALAIPVMLEQLGQIFLGTVDTYFAGQIGDNAIAAINVSNMFTNLFTGIFASLGIGVLVKISHALGEGDDRRANSFLRQGLLLGCGAGLLIGILCFLFRRPFLMMAGARGEILSLSLTYYTVVCVPCVFISLSAILSNGLKALQNTRASMQAALAANLTNALLDLIFVSMELGVFGLALATTLSRILNVYLLLRVYLSGIPHLKLDRSGWRPEPSAMTSLAAYSLPILLTQLSNRFISLISGSLVLHLGDLYYVTHSITNQLDSYVCIPMMGFEAAAATLVSSSVGAKRPKQAVRYAVWSCATAVVCMTALGILMAFLAVPLASIFTSTVEIQLMVRDMFVFLAFLQWTSALAQVGISIIQGIGDSRLPFIVTLICNITIRLGGGYFMAYVLGWKLIGIWAGFMLDFLCRCVVLGIRFRRFAKQAAASPQ